jgi:hypothetical protein
MVTLDIYVLVPQPARNGVQGVNYAQVLAKALGQRKGRNRNYFSIIPGFNGFPRAQYKISEDYSVTSF